MFSRTVCNATSQPHIPPARSKTQQGLQCETDAKKQDPPQVARPGRESITLDPVQAAARQRVGKLEAILTTLGNDDEETAAVIQAALTKARAQAQERPHPERVERGSSWRGKQRRVEPRGQGGSGGSGGVPGEGRSSVGRWG